MTKCKLSKKYSFKVFWSKDDGEYVATCEEYPSMSWLDPDPSEALFGLIVVLMEEERLDAEEPAEE